MSDARTALNRVMALLEDASPSLVSVALEAGLRDLEAEVDRLDDSSVIRLNAHLETEVRTLRNGLTSLHGALEAVALEAGWATLHNLAEQAQEVLAEADALLTERGDA